MNVGSTLKQPENNFFKLTPDVIIKTIEKEGFQLTGHCMVLNSYENRVYDLKLEKGSHIITKFYRPGRWSKEEIQEEHNFLIELKEREISVCAPLCFEDGQTIHCNQDIYYAVWPRTGGRAKDELADGDLQILGRLLARMHNQGETKTLVNRLTLTGKTYGLDSLSFLLENNFIPEIYRERYKKVVNEIVEIYDTLCNNVPFHRIHGDCHLGNLLYDHNNWFFLDFDDFLTGPAVQDFWMLVPARDQEGLRQRQVFLEAYQQFRNFNIEWLKLIEPLRTLRYIRYAAWIARRWDDPAFKAAFTHFGTDSYWEQETKDLESQLEYFYQDNKVLPKKLEDQRPRKEEEELTNKDFFWDWEGD